MEFTYRIGEYVYYSTNGICLVENIGVPEFSDAMHYFLRPISNMNTTIFLPVNNEILLSKMRSVLSKDEIDRIIDSVKTVDNETKWPENKRQRSAYFDEVLRGNNTKNIFNLASRLHLEKLNLSRMGKKPLSCDHNAMLQAEWLIENEFSFVLKIPNEAVREYIIAKLNNS